MNSYCKKILYKGLIIFHYIDIYAHILENNIIKWNYSKVWLDTFFFDKQSMIRYLCKKIMLFVYNY